MSTEIVILAQGQRQLGSHGPAQLQPLPTCGSVPILCRTVRQVSILQESSPDGEWWPRIITWPHVHAAITFPDGTGDRRTVTPSYVELATPGNSALRGVGRYLEQRDRDNRRYDHTIVLLGDVVYSWECLRAIWQISKIGGFVGTRHLALDKGDLWGVGWSRALNDRMMLDLRDALLRHPPFEDEYRHGQLRRWVSGFRRGDLADHVIKMQKVEAYTAIDDYTHDIDFPGDLVLLPDLSAAAAADDAKHGVIWGNGWWEGDRWTLP